MLRFALCFAALLATSPVLAQDASVPLSGTKPSQEQLDAAMDLLKANNTSANALALLDTLAPLQAAQMRRAHPDASDAVISRLQDVMRNSVVTHQDEMLRIYAIGYAQHFSIDELHALTAFYRSEVGQKYLNEIPPLLKEISPVAISFIQRAIAEDIQRAIENMRKEGVKI